MKKIIYGVKFIWISIGNLDPTIIFVILEWLLLVYWSRSISLVFLRGSPLDRRIPTAIDDEQSSENNLAAAKTHAGVNGSKNFDREKTGLPPEKIL